MRVLCSIWNRASVFYQVLTSSRNPHLHLCAFSAMPGRDAHRVCFSWGLKGKAIPGAACLPWLVLGRSQERALDISTSCALWLQKPSTPYIFLQAQQLSQRCATQQRIFVSSQSPFPSRSILSLPCTLCRTGGWRVQPEIAQSCGSSTNTAPTRIALQEWASRRIPNAVWKGENTNEGVKRDELCESTWPVQNTCNTFAESNPSKGEAFSSLV